MTTMPDLTWVFPGRTLRVVDGDTVDVELDLGLHGRRIERLRLVGVNAPEMHGPSAPAGAEAKSFTLTWLAEVGE